MSRSSTVASFTALVLLVGVAPIGSACSCAGPFDLSVDFARSAAVFLGEVVEISIAPPVGRFSVLSVKMRVEENWKGAPSDTIRLLTRGDEFSCGFTFKLGTRYLVFAEFPTPNDPPHLLWAFLCSRTHATWSSDPDLDLLNARHTLRVMANPNPSREETRFTWAILTELSQETHVRLDVLDFQGRRVTTLVDAPIATGPHETVWDGRDAKGIPAPSGFYWVRLAGAGQVASRKFVRIRARP